MARRLMLLCFVLAAMTLPAADPDLAQLSWLAGDWVGTLDQAQVEEVRLQPAGGAMLGLGRTVVGGRMVEFELLRLVVGAKGIEYLASPDGRCPPTPFRLLEAGGQRAVFANPEHDFPQRIEYRREGDVLNVRIEGAEEGKAKALEWQLRRRDPCAAR